MRTSIILEDELGARLRRAAAERGQSLSAFLAEAGRVALRAIEKGSEPVPFELIVAGEEGPHPGIDLDRTSELLAAEDRERFGQ